MIRKHLLGVLAGLAMTPLFLVSSWAQSPFYEGKAITILIGTTGGGSIVAARIIARHLGKYLPGNPAVNVQPMLGGAHIVASNHVFNTAKPDGLTLLAANPNIAIAQLIKVDGVRFDVRKFEWLGSSGSDGLDCRFYPVGFSLGLPYRRPAFHPLLPQAAKPRRLVAVT
ncbi:MAG: hypothetical protein A3F90_06240 [Deltaproteobacteria bacterium RIFCSPLOWO2_12_FULL_60_19]|nr:MAG: hypothetical protein A3F90_06240 [Deltaproteobacteria bacterium RIFCSPLOWO2_12_FULL_60_19]